MNKLFVKGYARKAEHADVIEFVATDESVDRSGESIPINSWDLRNYKRAPRLLVDHNYSVKNIVGIAEKIRTEGKQLVFRPKFHDITELARETAEMVKQGYLNTVSVGFIRHYDDKEKKSWNELLEVSLVSVPANPNARMKSVEELANEVTETEAKQIEEYIEKETEPEQTPEPEQTVEQVVDEVIQELQQRQLTDEDRAMLTKKVAELSALAGSVGNAAPDKGRDPKVEPKRASAVVRALQDVNRLTNELLHEMKSRGQAD